MSTTSPRLGFDSATRSAAAPPAGRLVLRRASSSLARAAPPLAPPLPLALAPSGSVRLRRRAGRLRLRLRSFVCAAPLLCLRPPWPRPRAPSSTVRTTWPTFTFSPGLTRTSLTVPATLEGTSIVALSVSSSRTGWSFATVSPGRDQHAHDVAGGDVLAELRKLEFCRHTQMVSVVRGQLVGRIRLLGIDPEVLDRLRHDLASI